MISISELGFATDYFLEIELALNSSLTKNSQL
jgi:hypothetical protein